MGRLFSLYQNKSLSVRHRDNVVVALHSTGRSTGIEYIIATPYTKGTSRGQSLTNRFKRCYLGAVTDHRFPLILHRPHQGPPVLRTARGSSRLQIQSRAPRSPYAVPPPPRTLKPDRGARSSDPVRDTRALASGRLISWLIDHIRHGADYLGSRMFSRCLDKPRAVLARVHGAWCPCCSLAEESRSQ